MAIANNSRSYNIENNMIAQFREYYSNIKKDGEEAIKKVFYSDIFDEDGTLKESLDEGEQQRYKDYQEAIADWDKDYMEASIKEGNKELVHYVGPLGDFNYDPNEWEIEPIDAPDSSGDLEDEDGNKYTRIHCLHYKGDEHDGSKIKVPEGAKDLFMTFHDTKIESLPKIPNSVENIDAICLNCEKLENIDTRNLSESITSMAFSFANCTSLKSAPAYVPKKVTNMDYAFAGCASLQNTPILDDNVETMNGTYADCISLRHYPYIPDSVMEANFVTRGCKLDDKLGTSVDEKGERKSLNERIEKYRKDRDKERQKYEEQLNKQERGNLIGRSFSYMVQVHALKQQGYGFAMRLIQAYANRKSNPEMTRMSAAFTTLSHNKRGRGAIWGLMANNAKDRDKVRFVDKEEMLRRWDELNLATVNIEPYLKDIRPDAIDDVKKGLLIEYLQGTENSRSKTRIVAGYHGILDKVDDEINQSIAEYESGGGEEYGAIHDENGKPLSATEIEKKSKYYLVALQNVMTYSYDAQREIKTNKYMSDDEKKLSFQGLQKMNADICKDLKGRIIEKQERYHLFSDQQMQDIDRMFVAMGQQPIFEIQNDKAISKHSFNSKNHGYERKVSKQSESKIDKSDFHAVSNENEENNDNDVEF